MKVVYIDSQNIHKSTLDLGWIIDWESFYKYIKRKFEVDNVKMFLGYIKRFDGFYKKLEQIGFEIVFKETLILPNGEIKGNVDIDIAIHVMLDIFEGGLSKAYLITGDGDYNTLVDLLKKRKMLGRVLIPHRNKASKLLKKSAGADIQILDELRYFLEEKENPKE